MSFLEITAADFTTRNLGRNRQHRHATAMCVVKTIDQVCVSRSTAPGTDGETSGQVRLGSGRKRGSFFVSSMGPLHVAALAERVGDAVERVARDPVNAFDTGQRQCVDNYLRYSLFSHAALQLIAGQLNAPVFSIFCLLAFSFVILTLFMARENHFATWELYAVSQSLGSTSNSHFACSKAFSKLS
jgi:hypothetical protein